MPRFTLMHGREQIQVFNLPKDRVLIGRNEQADIVLDNLMISREHAEVRRVGVEYHVSNLAGKNGVFLNGKWIDNGILRHGDVIELGKYSLKFEYPRDEQEKMASIARKEEGAAFKVTSSELLDAIQSVEEPTDAQHGRSITTAAKFKTRVDDKQQTYMLKPEELAKVRETMSLVKKAHLMAMVGTGQRTFNLERASTKIGKGDECDIKVKAGWLVPKISAIIFFKKDFGYFLEAQGGSVKVNGATVKGDHKLADKEVIEVEGSKFRFNGQVTG